MLKPIAPLNPVRRLFSLGLSLAAALGALLLLARWVGAAGLPQPANLPSVVFNVNTTLDAPDHFVTDTLCLTAGGKCSLRAAVQQLDHLSGGTIMLPAGTYTLTDAAGDLQFQKDISLLGAGPSVTVIQGNPSGWTQRILRVQPFVHAIVSGVTISGGHAIGAVGGGPVGGGIAVISATLLVTNSVVRNNTAGQGGGIYTNGQVELDYTTIRDNQAVTGGGGLMADFLNPIAAGAYLALFHSQVLNNNAIYGPGGGIDYDTAPSTGTLLVSDSTLSGNQTLGGAGVGGAIYQSNGPAQVIGSTLRNNQALEAGGIHDIGGPLEVTSSAIETNTAQSVNGGGIEISNAGLKLSQVTLRGNHAGSSGGGLNSTLSRLDVSNSSFISNTAATFFGGGLSSQQDTGWFTSTVFAQNLASLSGGGVYNDSSALTFTLSAMTNNLARDGAGLMGVRGGPPAPIALINSTLSGNHAAGWGGGLAAESGATVTLLNSNVTANTAAFDGGGLYLLGGVGVANNITGGSISGNTAFGGASGRNGGGLYTHSLLHIDNTVLIGNQALLGEGGGLFNAAGGLLFATQVDLEANASPSQGGGGLANQGHATLSTSTVRNNTAENGGGVGNYISGTLSIVGSTLSGNISTDNTGGGLNNEGSGAKVTMVNSTVSDNQTVNFGGGVANFLGSVDLSNVTVAGNIADSNANGSGDGGGLYNGAGQTFTLRNTVVALNVDTGGQAPDCVNSFQSAGYNLVKSTLGCTLAGDTTGNHTGLDPKLWPLGNWGGPTQTRPPAIGSPLLETGNPTGCRDSLTNFLSTDQRGGPRPVGPRCDIGAVEGASLIKLLLPLVRR